MSNGGKSEFEALEALEAVIGNLTEELATWRRRAQKAESDRSALSGGYDAVATREKALELEAANADLSARLEVARERVNGLLERLRFLEEQVALEEQAR